jgi:hypothetical protein
MTKNTGEFGPPERVYVENERYDGPRAGVADINGIPHRFKSLFDEAEDDDLGTFVVWPIDAATLKLEIEQWKIFVEWNASYESRTSKPESHPGNTGTNRRWDQIDELLKESRENVPDNAQSAVVKVEPIDRANRYELGGPDYRLRWRIL